MIPTSLKVGDTFIDGNKYEVIALCEQGYISKRVGIVEAPKTLFNAKAVNPTPVEEKAVTEDVDKAQLDSFNTYTKTEINRLNNTELEAVCDKLGLEKSTGVAMKKAIIDHLGL